MRRCLGNYHCPNCENKFILTFESAATEDDEYFCCDSIEELNTAFKTVEAGRPIEGIHAVPATAVRLIPKSYTEGR